MSAPDGGTSPPAVVLRHYTDDAGKEGIETTGMISPGIDGRVYLTQDAYDHASEAQARLSLPWRPTGFFEVPAEAISDHGTWERVLPDYGQPGWWHPDFDNRADRI